MVRSVPPRFLGQAEPYDEDPLKLDSISAESQVRLLLQSTCHIKNYAEANQERVKLFICTVVGRKVPRTHRIVGDESVADVCH
jgi:hypothetical protein